MNGKQFGVILLIAILAAGCATVPRPTPLTQADVISMTKAGVTDDDIISRIEKTRTVFKLGASDVVRLREEGVSEPVVNHMLETYTRAVVNEQRRRDYDYYGDYYRFHMWYGYPWWW